MKHPTYRLPFRSLANRPATNTLTEEVVLRLGGNEAYPTTAINPQAWIAETREPSARLGEYRVDHRVGYGYAETTVTFQVWAQGRKCGLLLYSCWEPSIDTLTDILGQVAHI